MCATFFHTDNIGRVFTTQSDSLYSKDTPYWKNQVPNTFGPSIFDDKPEPINWYKIEQDKKEKQRRIDAACHPKIISYIPFKTMKELAIENSRCNKEVRSARYPKLVAYIPNETRRKDLTIQEKAILDSIFGK